MQSRPRSGQPLLVAREALDQWSRALYRRLSELVGESVREVMSALNMRKAVVFYDVAVGCSGEDGSSLPDLLADETEVKIEKLSMEGALNDLSTTS